MADLEKLKRLFAEARQLTEPARAESLRCVDYYDSDQYSPGERAALAARNQPAITVNRIKPAINGVLGVTERARSDPRAWPRNPAGADAADVATDVLRYVADFNRFKRLKQDCFWDMLVPGTMAALVGVDADRQVTISQIRWEELFADPRARRRDFKDARFLGIAKWMYADDLAALYPDKAAAIEASVDTGSASLMPDASYQDRPLQGAGGAGLWIDPRQRRLMVIEIYYREDGWKRACFTAGDVLEDGPSPYRDHHGRPDCPIEAMSAYVRRDNARYGPAWDMLPIQDEINRRRSKALHLLTVNRVQARSDQIAHVDADRVRAEAARPDGVLPQGWEMAPSTTEFGGNLELLAEAKAEMERMAPNPAMLGRGAEDNSGRALLARQQAGLVELAVLFGGLEDWELRVYRQCWARVRQFWTAPAFIRVTDDENAPRFVGLNQPVEAPPGSGVLGYRNLLAEMDVDIEIDSQPDVGVVAQEQFSDLMAMIGRNPAWQSQMPIDVMIELSSIPHKRSVLDMIRAARPGAEAKAAQAEALEAQHLAAATAPTPAEQPAPDTPPSPAAELHAMKLGFSRKAAEREYGKETLAKVHDWALAKAAAEPDFNASMFASGDPYEDAVQAWRREQVLAAFGEADPAELEAFRAWKASQPAPAADPPPRSLVTALGNGATTAVDPAAAGDGAAFATAFN